MGIISSEPVRALVLAGGGMRVAYQAGVVRALADAGVTFDHIDATSGGIINAAMLLSGLTPEEMCERWETLNPRRFVSWPSPVELLRGSALLGWGDADGIRERVFPHLGVDIKKIRAHAEPSATFNVGNFTRKTIEAIPHDQIDLDLLVAGVSLPLLMPPVAHNDQLYVDAVWIKDANVLEAVRRGATEIWLVWCIGNSPKYYRGAFRQYVHMIEMAANGSLFEEFTFLNELNAHRASANLPAQPITLHVIKPDVALPLDPDYYFGRVSGRTLIERGYADAWSYIRTRTPQGVALTPAATSMRDPRPGLTFAEIMAGPFAMSSPDSQPVTGRLAMNVTVHIDNMREFVADPQHEGRLTGYVDFPPFGMKIPATHGVFKLFSPTDDPLMTHMVYELGFRHEGKSYYLAGHKEVRDDPGFDLWKDTTTLFTTLHEGDSAAGPILGKGTLRLGIPALFNLMRSMRTMHTNTSERRTRVIARFLRFFVQSLWNTYGPKPAQSFQPTERTSP